MLLRGGSSSAVTAMDDDPISAYDAAASGAKVIPLPTARQDGLPEFSDEALALKFTADHGNNLRYVSTLNKWLFWGGRRWEFDATELVLSRARDLCRRESSRCASPAQAKSVGSAKTVRAVEFLARADRRHAATPDQWDRDPWLLNTPDGVIDLRTGAMREHRQEDYLTRITAVSPLAGAPMWIKSLETITANDIELRAYLRRVAGYCLTGSTREHAMFFGFGTGANGKGTFLNTLTKIMGGYAVVAPMETFTASAGDRHPTELAMLRGARFVTAQETEEGRRWAEAKIAALTGGDPISAREMRQDFFTFLPVFKLFIAGNHKPGLRNVNEAIRRRFNLIPFTVTIPKQQRDPSLPDKLVAEWPGILAWMIQGCLEWQSGGLNPPSAVLGATIDYFEAEDTIKTWIDDRCILNAGKFTETGKLFASYKAWSEKSREFVISLKRFSQDMENRDFRRGRSGSTDRSGFYGIEIKQEDL